MATVTGVVDTLEKKAGKGPYVLKVGGHQYRVFEKAPIDGIMVGMNVAIEFETKPRDGYPDDLMILSCRETDSP